MSKPGQFKANLVELGENLLSNGPHKVSPTSRRIRIIHNGSVIVDTTNAVHVWEHEYYPQYYFPVSELQALSKTVKQEIPGKQGKTAASILEITVPTKDGKEVKNDRVLHFHAVEDAGKLSDLVRVEFGSVDEWLEEELPIYVHPKDPFKRIDILPSTRSVEVKVGGKTVAKSNFSNHLHEGTLPVRYYLPLGSIDQSVLRKSSTTTKCPYKGEAQYYDVIVDGKEYKDIVWYYTTTVHESAAIAGFLSFYNEKVDIFVDGKELSRTKSPFV